MRYATWQNTDGSVAWGTVVDDRVVPAGPSLMRAGLEPYDTLGDLIGTGDPELWRAAGGAIAAGAATARTGDVRLLAPYQPAGTIFAAGANYADHAEEARRAGVLDGPPDSPVIFAKATTSVCGPVDEVILRAELTQELDYEVELGVVIGVGGRDIDEADALAHVFGYTVVNDISARDVQQQRPGGQWFLGKSMDTFCPVGPWVVTADEIEDPHRLEISLSVNGEPRQKSTTAYLLFSVHALIAEISRFATLRPGDLLATGTPAGVGASSSPPRFLTAGDLVEASVGGIGRLTNRVVDG